MMTDNNNSDYEEGDEEDLDEEDLIIQAAATAAIAAGLSAIEYAQAYYDKRPYHDSVFPGIAWVLELLTGHPERIRKELGVHKHVFYALINTLKAAGCRRSKYVTLEEQLAIFLYTCVTGLSLVHVCERFQRAPDTASK
jgi:hypothetical protein